MVMLTSTNTHTAHTEELLKLFPSNVMFAHAGETNKYANKTAD